ncbi:MAG: hypothetical protein IJM57_10630 [Lachnospiraceae bacterium]|nr:hypothetical protein [Lachnospiraceae bacterium]
MKRKGTKKQIWAWLLTAMMFISLLFPCGIWNTSERTANADEETGELGSEVMAAYVNYPYGLNVRVAPGSASEQVKDKNGNPIQLTPATIVHVLKTVSHTSGEWAQIQFDYGDEKDLTGYVKMVVSKTDTLLEFDENAYDAEFEAALDAQGFPESYRKVLRAVHQWNPTWTFRAEILDLDWNTAVNAEFNEGASISNNKTDYLSSWKSLAQKDYNYAVSDGNGGLKDGGWVLEDSRYAQVSKEMLAYCMDPRNFLAESTIFMFEELDYNPSVQTITGVERILDKYDPVATGDSKNTFSKEVEGTTHAALFMQAAEQSGVNPYFLATRSVHEVNNSVIMQGNGVVSLYDGKLKYVGIYNYYNFNAYAHNGMGVIESGLSFASPQPEKMPDIIAKQGYDDLRPWNTRAKAIIGGAIRIANEYIKKGQNTPYYQRYNVAPKKNPDNGKIDARYSHQYMSLVTALYEESYMYYAGLLKDDATGDETVASAIETPFVFIIPVYKNMPVTPCARPTGDGNPNPYLASISIEGVELSPAFAWNKLEYKFTVEENVETLNVEVKPLAKTTQIVGAGEIKILYGENTYTIRCRAQNGRVVKYTLKILRKGEGVNPSVTPTPIEETIVTPTPIPTEAPVSIPPTPIISPTVTPTEEPTSIPVTPSISPTVTPTFTPTPTPEKETITSKKYQVTEQSISNIDPGTSVAEFLKEIAISGGEATLLNAKGEEVTEGNIGTGWLLKTEHFSIPIIVYGDVNGDGAITALDLLYVKRHILGINSLSGVFLSAGDVKTGDGISALDLLYVKRHILGISAIVQKQ